MQPLALLVYEAILPGSQLVNRLRELGYRILVLPDADSLVETATHERPMVILLDLVSEKTDMPACITALRANASTAHVPVLAFAPLEDSVLQDAARQAGATLIAISHGILEQLPALLTQVLDVR
jgi:PleD family two-component response regulator